MVGVFLAVQPYLIVSMECVVDLFFFFQAEDGIRDLTVTGVQTCALPILRVRVEVARDAVRLHVTDEGNGFDPAGVPDPTLPERLEREDGRGLFVLRSLVDQVAFNKKGNSVCLTLRAG